MAAKNTDQDAGLATIIETTITLFEQKDEIYAKLATARTAARALVAMGVGNEDQHKWVAEYLPLKQKGVTRARINGNAAETAQVPATV